MYRLLLFFSCFLLVTKLSGAIWSGAGDPENIWDTANWHGGIMPSYEDPVWDIAAGLTARLDTAAPPWIIKRGEGTLVLGSSLPENTSIEVEQGVVSWVDAVTLGHLRISGGTISAGQGLQVGLMEIAEAVDFNLSTIPNLTTETLRVETSGTVMWSTSAVVTSLEITSGLVDFTNHIVPPTVSIALNGGTFIGGIINAQVTATSGTVGSTIQGNFYLRGGQVRLNEAYLSGQILLEGGTVTGSLFAAGNIFVPFYGNETRIEGTLYQESMALVWLLEMPELAKPLVITGEYIAYSPVLLDFGLVNWQDDYWNEIREFTVIDVWEGGLVDATFYHDEATGDGQGLWSRVDPVEGDLIMRWNPLDTAPIPEASTSGLLAVATLLLASVRRKRRVSPQ